MRVDIHYGRKYVDCYAGDQVDAGWLGFKFARDNRDLVEAGWKLWYFKRDPQAGTLDVEGARGLAEAIRRGPPFCSHSCHYHKPVELGF